MQSEKKVTETKKPEIEHLVLELIDQQPSNYKTDDKAAEHDYTSSRSAPGALKIMSTSWIVVYEEDPKTKEKDWRMVKTRYIKGADTFRVDEQDARNIKPNAPGVDVIWMIDGKLIVYNIPENAAMFNYLKKGFNGNIDMEVSDTVRRPEDCPDQVRVISSTKSSKAEEKKIDLEDKAVDYLRTLRYEKDGEVSYNGDALEFIANLYQLPAFDSGYDSAECWLAVRGIAKQDPAKFLNTIASKRGLVESDVMKGKLKGVLMIDEQKATMQKTKKVLVDFAKFGNTSEEERLQALVDFFANPENSKWLDQLRINNRNANVDANEVLT